MNRHIDDTPQKEQCTMNAIAEKEMSQNELDPFFELEPRKFSHTIISGNKESHNVIAATDELNAQVTAFGGNCVAVSTANSAEVYAENGIAIGSACGCNATAHGKLAYTCLDGTATVSGEGIAIADYGSKAIATDKRSIAIAHGKYSQAQGVLGSWLILVREHDPRYEDYDYAKRGPFDKVFAVQVDGEKILPNVAYHINEWGVVERCDILHHGCARNGQYDEYSAPNKPDWTEYYND
jgi:hypothetical protein